MISVAIDTMLSGPTFICDDPVQQVSITIKYWIIIKNENSNGIRKTFLLKELCFRRLFYLKLKKFRGRRNNYKRNA